MRFLALTLSALVLLAGACAPARPPSPPPASPPPEGVIATPPHVTPTPGSSPAPGSGGPLLRWENKECQALESDGKNLSYGPCDGALTTVAATPEDLLRLAQWQAIYKPIDASNPATPAGILKFNGQGSVRASDAEQRAMAEWANLRYQELVSGRTGAAWSLALDWNRIGGIAGFCDEVTVYLTGDYTTSNCKLPTATPAATLQPALPNHLDPKQLNQLYTWYDSLTTFDYDHTDPAVADAMTLSFTFNGRGKQHPTDADIQAINDFASSLLGQAAQAPYPPAALAAQQALAKSLGIPVSEVTIVSVTRVDWPDSCLGIRAPGIMCAQVITPGYLVVVEANGNQYSYRIDLGGANPVQAP